MDNVYGIPLANIVRAEIITKEDPAKVYIIETASEATANPFLSAGAEQELRIRNQILAQNSTLDIVKGYDVTLNDALFAPEVFALIDGGKSVVVDDAFESYDAPIAGEVASRIKSQLAVYTEEKDYDGEALSYVRLVFPGVKGTPATVSIKDGEFYAPSYTLKSRPSKGHSPLAMQTIPALPTYVSDADELVMPPSGSAAYVCTAELTYLSKDYKPGDIIIVGA